MKRKKTYQKMQCCPHIGLIYCLDNGKIISFQDDFKLLGNVPFTVYFDFETTTEDDLCGESKMYVIILQMIKFNC